MKQFLFIKSATDVTTLPVSAFSHAEYASDTSVTLYFRLNVAGGEGSVAVTLAITSGKASEVVSSISSQAANSNASVFKYDAVKNTYFTSNVTGIDSITPTAPVISNQLSQEQIEDFAGGLFTGNTETGITATYQTSDNTVDLVVANQVVSLAAGGLTDVDTSSVAANDILVWNGSGFVVESMATMMGNNTLFTFALSSFSDGISGTQLIGDGTWKAADAINFSAVYVAGPPDTSATIQKSINGGSYSDMNAMDSAAFTSGNNDAVVGYPPAKDQTLQFRLKVVNDGVTAYANGGALSFQNKVFYGASTSTSLNEAGVEGLSSAITNSYLSSRSINSSSGKYVYIAFPATYADIHANGFKFNGITCPFGSKATVTITNTAGYEEDYDVYRSVNNSLGNSTLNLSTSATINNTIFYGLTTATSSLSVSSFVSSPGEATNADVTRQWPSITTGAGQYMLFAWPARFSDPTFNVGGFDGGFESATTANFTNDNGYTESYKFFRATNPNLGAKVVTTS